ncbi:ubiquitin-conjugating enzyme E2 variant 1-like [Symsagittifera roscoffensis]|uniref:ubiquitin-conjugating enzyme E2 variant 1-like n=1 Tax=Symsagittifera roscoffensis TaxID=84072 RepID=UPI00307B8279
MAESTNVPRSFKLLDEHEESIKYGDPMISWGLADSEDMDMREWVGSIFGPPKTTFDSRIYSLNIRCSQNYPDEPPSISFNTRINLSCVDSKGKVLNEKVDCLRNWRREYTIKKALESIRSQMSHKENAKLQQPAEGTPPYSQ